MYRPIETASTGTHKHPFPRLRTHQAGVPTLRRICLSNLSRRSFSGGGRRTNFLYQSSQVSSFLSPIPMHAVLRATPAFVAGVRVGTGEEEKPDKICPPRSGGLVQRCARRRCNAPAPWVVRAWRQFGNSSCIRRSHAAASGNKRASTKKRTALSVRSVSDHDAPHRDAVVMKKPPR